MLGANATFSIEKLVKAAFVAALMTGIMGLDTTIEVRAADYCYRNIHNHSSQTAEVIVFNRSGDSENYLARPNSTLSYAIPSDVRHVFILHSVPEDILYGGKLSGCDNLHYGKLPGELRQADGRSWLRIRYATKPVFNSGCIIRNLIRFLPPWNDIGKDQTLMTAGQICFHDYFQFNHPINGDITLR